MGREIRKVPPNWQHPRYTDDNAPRQHLIGKFMALFDEAFDDAAREWLDNCIKWDRGEDENCAEHKADHPFYWMWDDNPPDANYYRPAFTEKPTWFQMYETVSEGTPCTPPFETKAELVDWLVEKGENHDTEYEKRFTRSQAEAFVDQGWAPSFVMTTEHGIQSGVEFAATLAGDTEGEPS